jgi:ElaB/YqjD/DUF883 family membrane-anchored ribosome-binding protein
MTKTEKEIKELKDNVLELKTLLSEDEGSARESKQENLSDQVKTLARSSGKNLRGMIDGGKEKFNQKRDDYESTIKQKPFKSVLSAFGAGVLLTAILKK